MVPHSTPGCVASSLSSTSISQKHSLTGRTNLCRGKQETDPLSSPFCDCVNRQSVKRICLQITLTVWSHYKQLSVPQLPPLFLLKVLKRAGKRFLPSQSWRSLLCLQPYISLMNRNMTMRVTKGETYGSRKKKPSNLSENKLKKK